MRGVLFAALVSTTIAMPLAAALAQPTPSPFSAQQPTAAPKRGPANICQELVAFLNPPAPAQPAAAGAAPAAPPSQQTAVAAPQQAAGAGAAPAQASAPAAGQAAAVTTQPSGQGAPTASGIAGPTPPNASQGTPGPQAAGQNPAVTQPQGPAGQGGPAPAQPGQKPPAPPAQAAAPAAPAGPVAPKPTPAAIEKAQTAARDNSISGCKAAAQEMRRAGVALPAPLIALAGLDLKFLEAAQQP
jgi:hypothetical protein